MTLNCHNILSYMTENKKCITVNIHDVINNI